MSEQHESAPASREEVITAFSRVIETISRSMVQAFAHQLAPEGITVLQYHALKAIHRSGPELDMSTIATLTGLPASSVTNMVDRLAERGLVERRHHAADRRRVVARITGEGVALMERLQRHELERLRLLLGTSSTEEIAVCLHVFECIEARMQAIRWDGTR
jgi:DNA-binding MarR family transcriptional regulator